MEQLAQLDKRQQPSKIVETVTLVGNPPHNHIEVTEATVSLDFSSIIFTGGENAKVSRLQLSPVYERNSAGEDLLVGYDAIGFPRSGWLSDARYDTLNDLLIALKQYMALSTYQVEAVRRSLHKGTIMVIGGTIPSAIWVLQEPFLSELGLSWA